MCDRTGATYRQLDNWCRERVLAPARMTERGPGSRRRWTLDQVRIVALVTDLAALGAPHTVLRRVVESAERLPADAWTGKVYVDAAGVMDLAHPGTPAWAVDLGRCVEDRRAPVPA